MNKEVKELRKKFKKYNIDGYVVPKNDDYFTEYSKINRLKIISNFSGSAGLAIILKNKNYLFTDGRYTIQSKMESGKYFKIVSYEKIINCNLFKNLRLGLDPKLFTYQQIKNYFLKNNQIKFLSNNLIDEIKAQKVINSIPFFSLKDETVGENRKSKINKIVNYLKKNKADNLFVTAPENVAWILNIRGGDGPNSPIPNSRLIINKSKKILLITEPYKAKKLLKDQIIKKDQLVTTINLPKKILALNGKNFIIDNKSCSVFYENIIKSKFNIIKREDPTYLLKAIKNNTEINNMISSHIIDGVALTKFIYWIKKVNKKRITEVDAQIKLEKFRKKSNKYLYPSFETIAGAGENGAIVHYRAKKGSCRTIRKDDIFLCDSGGQYKYGTTDVTRTYLFYQNQNKVSKIFTPKY
jgi:Xaa-Pro aminopeptidase